MKKNKLKKIYGLILFSLCISNAFSQSTISGNIKSDQNLPISFVNVALKSITNQAVIEYCYSDDNGNYILNTNKTGKFNLSFSALSFQTEIIPIEINSLNIEIKQNKILIYHPIELKEVIITKEKAILVKKDTIVFNVKNFLKGNEQVVEDLLKKIPGLNVSSDGVVKVGNQEIEKIMIDGDDFFEKGYKLITKNMSVNPIDKIELIQHYSNNKHLKGIEDSDKVALNLKLKDNAKREWFGNMSLGYGLVSENRYELRGNLMNFGKKNKYYFLTNLNNIGEDATGDIDNLIRPYRFGETSSIGDNQSANIILSLSTDTPNLKDKRVNFNNAEMLSLNNILALTTKLKLKTLAFYNSDKNSFFKNNLQSFSLENTNFQNINIYNSKKQKITGFGKLELTYDITKNKTLEVISKLNQTNQDDKSDLNFNENQTNESLNSKNQLIDQKIVFTNKFKEKQVFLLTARYINEKTPQLYSTNQFFYQDLFPQNIDNVIQNSENKMLFAGFEGHLISKDKRGNLYELKLGNEFRKDNLITNFSLKLNGNIINEPLNYQNKTTYSVNDLYFITKYNFKFNRLSILPQLEVHKLENTIIDFETSENQSPFFINPKLGFDLQLNKKNKIQSTFSLNKTNAKILDVFKNHIQTSFNSFSKGTGNFNQLDTSSILLNYTYGSWGDIFFANTFLLYSKNNDFFSYNTLIAQNYTQSEKIVIQDRENIVFSSNIEKYFKSISSNFKLNLGGSKSNYKNIVNNSNLREIKTMNINYGFELRSGFICYFNYHIGTKWNFNEVNTVIKKSFTDNTSFLDLIFIFNDKFNFQIQTERYFFGNLDNQKNKYYFLDLEAKYILKENKISFSLSANNLFNTNTFRNYSISDVSISNTEYKLQPRYILLKMDYRF